MLKKSILMASVAGATLIAPHAKAMYQDDQAPQRKTAVIGVGSFGDGPCNVNSKFKVNIQDASIINNGSTQNSTCCIGIAHVKNNDDLRNVELNIQGSSIINNDNVGRKQVITGSDITAIGDSFTDKKGNSGRFDSNGKMVYLDKNGNPGEPDHNGNIIYTDKKGNHGYPDGRGNVFYIDNGTGQCLNEYGKEKK